jgi:ATP-dependent RNA helicase DDX1
MEQAMIFVRTKLDADNLEVFINKLNEGLPKGPLEKVYTCAVLHAGRAQKDRKANLEAFKSGDVRFLICTDVAARGIDVKELPYVISTYFFIIVSQTLYSKFSIANFYLLDYTLPDRASDYVHRIGRVGRAEHMGLAISLVAKHHERVWFHKFCRDKESCNNTKLLDEGGCTIWYTESEYLPEIEKLVGKSLPRLGPDYKLPESVGLKYGAKRGEDDHEQIFKQHAEFLRPIVAELAVLESKVQSCYWALHNKYSASSSS